MRPRRRTDGERGAAAVEFALVLPLLVILVFGVIDVGRMLATKVAIQGATQEGAMFASFQPNSTAAIKQRVVESLENPALATSDVTVACPTDRVRVSVSHDLDLLTPLVSGWLGGSVTLSETITGQIYSDLPCGGP